MIQNGVHIRTWESRLDQKLHILIETLHLFALDNCSWPLRDQSQKSTRKENLTFSLKSTNEQPNSQQILIRWFECTKIILKNSWCKSTTNQISSSLFRVLLRFVIEFDHRVCSNGSSFCSTRTLKWNPIKLYPFKWKRRPWPNHFLL